MKKNILYGTVGIMSFLFFLIGFMILISSNPQVIAEIDNLALSYFNLEGMNGRQLANFVIYIGAGLLSFFTLIGLLIENRRSSQLIIGISFLIVSALNWISFGLTSRGIDDIEGDGKLVLLRTIVFLLTSVMGLMLVGTDKLKLNDHRVAKWSTLTIGVIITSLGILSTFVINDNTWWRTNLSISLFFIWIGIIGILFIRTKNTANIR